MPTTDTTHPQTPQLLIERKARDFDSSQHIEIGNLPYGADVIHNAPPYAFGPNMVAYKIIFDAAASYDLWIEYAAKVSRSCEIRWNNSLLEDASMRAVTGGWEESFQKWHKIGTVTGGQGIHELQIDRAEPFPHIRAIKLQLKER